jgi:hypothetical protein
MPVGLLLVGPLASVARELYFLPKVGQHFFHL